MSNDLRIAVVGATGAVGQVIVKLLQERNFPVGELVPFASSRSVGKKIATGETVQALSKNSITGFDLVLFSAGGQISEEWAPRFVQAGAVVIDNSSHWRMDPEVPLIISEVNPEKVSDHRGIIANPNCAAMQMLVTLKPLYDAVGIERITVSTYQATSGTGQKAIQELIEQTRSILAGNEIQPPTSYHHQIAFNVLPHAGSFVEGEDHTDEEQKIINETQKILDDPEIRVSATCVRVPVINGHSEAVNIETKVQLSANEARSILRSAPGVTVIDDPQKARYPLPIDVSGSDGVFVGRIRKDPSHDNGLSLWISADNLRKGAATNAVQIAELVVGSEKATQEVAVPIVAR